MTSPVERPLGRVAERLIAVFGKPAVLKRPPGGFDPQTSRVTGGNVAGDHGEYPGKCLIERYRGSEIDGTTVKRGDAKATFAAMPLPIVPQPNDVLLLDEVAYRVVDVEPVYGGEKAVIYTLQVRR